MVKKKENGLDEEKQDQEESGKKKKFPLKLIILFTVGLFLIGGGVFVWKGGLLNKLIGHEGKAIAAKTAISTDKTDIGPIFSMDTFIVNLVDPHGKKYLKLRLELELSVEELRMEIDRRMPQFKDTILTLLSSKTYEDVSSQEGKLQLRAEMMSMLNHYLKSGSITNIYFTEFIVQ